MNADDMMGRREQVSALVDGQLEGLEFAAAMDLTDRDDDALASWHVYHVIGDVLRSDELGACGRDRDFVSRLSARIQAESTLPGKGPGVLIDPDLIAYEDHLTMGISQKEQKMSPPANDSIFRWKLVAGLASLAALAVVNWSVTGALRSGSDGARLAQSSSGGAPLSLMASPGQAGNLALAEPGTLVMVRDPRLDELLAAHRQLGGTSALQNPSGFLRNATFEGTSR
jgi:sigma-E factor negative regulatory protein RseA